MRNARLAPGAVVSRVLACPDGDRTPWKAPLRPGVRMVGRDVLWNEWRYITVRRIPVFMEATIDSGTWWVVSQPSDPPRAGRCRCRAANPESESPCSRRAWGQGSSQSVEPPMASTARCQSDAPTLPGRPPTTRPPATGGTLLFWLGRWLPCATS
jgi:hypothetical protein